MLDGIPLTLAAGVLGLVIGSFLNVVIHRLPRMLERRWRAECAEYLETPPPEEDTAPYNLVLPPSNCPACGRRIKPWENVPVLSYIALRGRCAGCSARISAAYPVVELLTGLLSALIAWRFGWSPACAGALLFSWVLIAAAAIDTAHYLLPDALVLPLLWAGLLFNAWQVFVPLRDALIGAVAGYLVLWIVFQAFRLLTGKEGMGRGDFKLLACLGAWTGWRMLPLILLAAAGLGVVIGGAWLLSGRRGREHPIPFGPFLAGAGVLALLAGPPIVMAYLHWVGPGRH